MTETKYKLLTYLILAKQVTFITKLLFQEIKLHSIFFNTNGKISLHKQINHKANTNPTSENRKRHWTGLCFE
jgi:hypothetical protein